MKIKKSDNILRAERRMYEDPTVLQQYIYYMLSMTFGYRGRDILHQLKKDSFVEGRDALGSRITLVLRLVH